MLDACLESGRELPSRDVLGLDISFGYFILIIIILNGQKTSLLSSSNPLTYYLSMAILCDRTCSLNIETIRSDRISVASGGTRTRDP